MKAIRQAHILGALSLFIAADLPAAVMETVSELAVSADEATAPETWRGKHLASEPVPTVTLLPLAAERVLAVKRSNASSATFRLQIGIDRHLSSENAGSTPSLHWHDVSGGRVAYLDVVSPGAKGMRLGISPELLPPELEIRVSDSELAATIFAVSAASARDQADGSGIYWSAVARGDRQRLELFLPDAIDTTVAIAPLVAVAHLLVSPSEGSNAISSLGASGACQIDAVCGDGPLGADYAFTKRAVAHMQYQSNGGAFICTGTLLNDANTNTSTPWFFTASHCISNQAQANSLVTFWDYESPTCGVDNPGPNIQVTGGAQLMFSDLSTDAALLRLNGTPPAGAVFAGWNANPLQAPASVVGIHHPQGDIKKVSTGLNSGAQQNVPIPGGILSSAYRASWAQGTMEGGSSGSGLFTIGNGYQLRGGLWGGSTSCANSGLGEGLGNLSFYSRLDLVYPAIQQYIGSVGGNVGPTRDHTGQWDVGSEGGRGLSLFQFGVGSPSNVLFGLWFVYDSQGRASWYQIDPAWTGENIASGRVVRWTGPPWGPTYNAANRSFVETGTFTLNFTSGTAATFTYNVDGVSRTVTLRKL